MHALMKIFITKTRPSEKASFYSWKMSRHDNMLHLLNLPEGILEKILSCMPYDDIARQRLVCRKFDQTCKMLLNRGFVAVERYHAACLKNVKAQLPRRESERRMHPMFRHCEILTAVETRLSMLSMTFMRYVDIKLCCFIPGKVIDEIFRVLRHVMTSNTQLRAHELLQELRDISSMAMEHFDEKVVPRLKQHLATSSNRGVHSVSIAGPSNLGLIPSRVPTMNAEKSRLANDFSKMQSQSKHNKKNVDSLKRTVRRLQLKLKRHGVQLSRQSARLREQSQKLREQDTVIAEMKRHMQEWDMTLSEMKAGRLVNSDSLATSEASSSGICSSANSSKDSISDLACVSSESSIDTLSGDVAISKGSGSKDDAPTKDPPKVKRTRSEVKLGPDSDELEVQRVKRFCRILKICENKAMKHNET